MGEEECTCLCIISEARRRGHGTLYFPESLVGVGRECNKYKSASLALMNNYWVPDAKCFMKMILLPPPTQ
jgi:hypothetical protein